MDPDAHLRRIFRRIEFRDAGPLDSSPHLLEIVARGGERNVVELLLRPLEEQEFASATAGLEPQGAPLAVRLLQAEIAVERLTDVRIRHFERVVDQSLDRHRTASSLSGRRI